MPLAGQIGIYSGCGGRENQDVSKPWYFSKHLTQMGPVDESELRAKIASGEVLPSDKVWTEGMPDWQVLAEVESLRAELPLRVAPPVASPYSPPASEPQPGAGMPASPPTSGLAIASLVCGLVGIVSCSFITGIPAVICGHLALGRIDRSSGALGGRTLALVGLITGYICVVLIAVTSIFLLTVVLAAGSAPHAP